jgi:hypothetical protein
MPSDDRAASLIIRLGGQNMDQTRRRDTGAGSPEIMLRADDDLGARRDLRIRCVSAHQLRAIEARNII